jgi:Resolvase, N terminal domain
MVNASLAVKTGRAATYVRMSTEHQQYSTANQADAIEKYADQHNLSSQSTSIWTMLPAGRFKMTEHEMIRMIQVVLSFVEEIHKGNGARGPFAIRARLRMYDENMDQLLGDQNG